MSYPPLTADSYSPVTLAGIAPIPGAGPPPASPRVFTACCPLFVRRPVAGNLDEWRYLAQLPMLPSTCGRSEQLDPSGVSGSRRQGGIPSDERGRESLSKGDIRGIIGGEIVPELPDSRKEDVMGIAGEREIH
jgi:hypothetical protein